MTPSARPLAATAVAVAVATAGLAVSQGAINPGDAAAADPCRWTLHSKRVVKRKRVVVNGEKKVRKIKKTKRWWSCDPVPDPPIEETPANRLLVRALDGGPNGVPFHFQPSRTNLDAGDVTVQLNNRSMDGHDLHLRPSDSLTPEFVIPELAPGSPPQGTLAEGTFNLTVGNWYLWCDLLDHEQWMQVNLVVAP